MSIAEYPKCKICKHYSDAGSGDYGYCNVTTPMFLQPVLAPSPEYGCVLHNQIETEVTVGSQ